jgi:zinc protease
MRAVTCLLLVVLSVFATQGRVWGGEVTKELPDLSGLLGRFGESEPVEPTVVANGLVLLVKEMHTAPVVTAQVYVKTGSMFEGEYAGSGISHVLEHLVHGAATPTHSEEETVKLLASIGGQSNASTWKESTRYYISTGREYLPLALSLLADWMTNAIISDEVFQREIKVINEEFTRSRDNPYRELWETAGQTLFQVHPTRLPVIGYPELLNALTREQVVDYYRRTYVPNNMVLIIVGDVSREEARKEVEATFGKLTRGFIEPTALPEEPEQVAKRVATKEFPTLAAGGTALLRMDVRTVPLTHPDLYPLDVLAYILSQGRSSRLVERLREERRLVSRISAYSVTPGFDAGYFAVAADCDVGKLPAVEEAVWAELTRLREEEVSPEELAKAKRQKISEYFYGRQTVESEAAGLASGFLAASDANFDLTYAQNIQRVTAEDIRRVARTYLRDEALCVTVLRPPSATAQAPTGAVERAEQPPASPAPRPQASEVKMPNGLLLLVKEDHRLPLVAVQATSPGGVRAETEETNGLFTFTAAMLTRGTERRSAQEIARFLDERGATLGAATGRNTIYLTGQSISADFDDFFALAAEVLTQASFPEAEMERLRPVLLEQVRRRYEQGEQEALLFFAETMYPQTPGRFFQGGREEVLAKLTREDLLRCYRGYVRPERMVLAVFGDVDSQAVIRKVEETLGAVSLTEPPAPLSPPRANPPRAEAVKAEKLTDKQKAYVAIGYPGMRVVDVEDRVPMLVLNAVMSGIRVPGGWLHEALRGPASQGLVYGVYAYDEAGVDAGSFIIFADCDADRTQLVTDLMLQQVERAKTTLVSAEELERAQRTAVTAQELSLQSLGEQALDAALNELYGLGFDFTGKLMERVRNVSSEDLQRVARKYFANPVVTVCRPKPKGEVKQ